MHTGAHLQACPSCTDPRNPATIAFLLRSVWHLF